MALRNIGLILQKRPGLLVNEVKVFVCKYYDPIYVKMEKLEIVVCGNLLLCFLFGSLFFFFFFFFFGGWGGGDSGGESFLLQLTF